MADAADDTFNCGSGGGADTYFSLRVASIFIILIGSSCGALFPVLAKRSSWLHVPKGVFEYVGFVSDFLSLTDTAGSFAKYFGSGVIVRGFYPFIVPLTHGSSQIATAFIHLLNPAIEALSSPCLAPGWSEYVSGLVYSYPHRLNFS